MSDSDETIRQAALLLEECALVERDGLARFRVTGADRVDYLHRMLTQDIAGLAIGAATYACLLTVKGRILGDMLVWKLDDHVVLEMPQRARDAVMAPLERYVIADDVVFEEVPVGPRRTLVGPAVDRCLESAGVVAPGDDGSIQVGDAQTLLRFDRRGLPQVEIVGAAPCVGVPKVSAEAYDIARVHHGIPEFASELGEDVLFNEAGLEEAVSWSKGCFPGQEPVVMARHRGRPPRLLVLLDCEQTPAVGADVLREGAVVGRVTSSAPAVAGRGPVALAYVKHALAKAGACFKVADAGAGVVQQVSGVVPVVGDAAGGDA